MKRCPTCNRNETDDTLVFCRLDGARLVSFDSESATAVLGSGSIAPAGTAPVASGATQPTSSSSAEYVVTGITRHKIAALIVLAALALAGVGLAAYLHARNTEVAIDSTISAELVDVRNNKSLWGEQYDRKTSELLATQRGRS